MYISLFAFAISTGCKKDNMDLHVGKWETVNAIGFKWEYNIGSDGRWCRALPKDFGNVEFCYPYTETGENKIKVQYQDSVFFWQFNFHASTVAEITTTNTKGKVLETLILKKAD